MNFSSEPISFRDGSSTYNLTLKPLSSHATPSNTITIGGRDYEILGEETAISALRKHINVAKPDNLISIYSFRTFLSETKQKTVEKSTSAFLNTIVENKQKEEEPPIAHREILNKLVPRLCPPEVAIQPQTLESQMKSYGIPGVSIAIIDNGVVQSEGFGNLVDKETKIQAASISKSITALTVLALVHQGLFRNGLDTDVREFLEPEVWAAIDPDNKTEDGRFPVTLRGLLSHTAGVTLGEGQSGFSGYPRAEAIQSEIERLEKKLERFSKILPSEITIEETKEIEEIASEIANLKLNASRLPSTDEILMSKPGVNSGKIKISHQPDVDGRMRYTGGGTTILQKVIEKVTDQPFAKVVKDQVLDKLGMDQSTYSESEGKYSFGHDENGNPISGGWRVYPEQAAAGLWSTPSDLAKVVVEVQKAALGNSILFGPTLAQEVLKPMKGLGFAVPPIESETGSKYFFHEGSNKGFRCILIGNLDGQGAVIMTNGDNGDSLKEELLSAIASSYLWKDAAQVDMLEPLMDVRVAIGIDQNEWGERCVGKYKFSPNAEETILLELSRQEGKTLGQITVQKKDESIVEPTFEISGVSPTRGCFKTNSSGPYQKMDLQWDKTTLVGVNIYGDTFVRMSL